MTVASRFLFHEKDEFNRNSKRVKPKAFYPHPRDPAIGRPETSVCDSESASEEEIWVAGRIVEAIRRQALLARADVQKADILSERLVFIRNDQGYFRHAIIAGWPDERDAQLAKAQYLSKKANLVLLA